jgi:hypothetical protein
MDIDWNDEKNEWLKNDRGSQGQGVSVPMFCNAVFRSS